MARDEVERQGGLTLELRRDFGQEVISTLKEVLSEGRYASSVIGDALSKNPEWSDRQRALFSNSVYDIIRYWRLLWNGLGREPSFDDRGLWHVLGAYQIKKGEEVERRPEYRGLSPDRVKKRLERARMNRAVRESVPDWMDKLGEEEIGEDWDDILHSSNTYSELAIRVNTLKTNKADLRKRLRASGHEAVPVEWAPDALVFKQKFNIFRSPEFQEGLFEVQDPASQAVAPFLDVRPGMKVADACAGQGGKTLHLSCLMQNTGRLLAMDDVEWKLDELRKRARRAGVQNAETKLITGTKSYKRLKGTMDRLLLDVPCTGLGSLRRNPDIKWSLDAGTLERLKELQKQILISYSPLLKPGGKMVYATCSILPSEGEEQVRWFLGEKNPGFELVSERRLRPDKEGFDGFYMALLERCKGS
ncbi:MAG: RsmB/NOP family class I SAM-dependent RNA methyltransferase [Candidatus Thermoplasmatota archaeon]|nr:RsmB/NOP family class I SAM-dependent RNA methyltransferase [Candidatus Thermoplasmatota archaeon]